MYSATTKEVASVLTPTYSAICGEAGVMIAAPKVPAVVNRLIWKAIQILRARRKFRGFRGSSGSNRTRKASFSSYPSPFAGLASRSGMALDASVGVWVDMASLWMYGQSVVNRASMS